MRHRYHGTLFLAAILASVPANAQSTAAQDSAHWRQSKIYLDSIARDRTAPQYSKRNQQRLRLLDSLRVFKPIPPGPVATTVDIHSNGTSVAVGSTLQLYAEVKDQNGVTIPSAVITWSAGPLAVADISGAGLLTGKSAGTSNVTAKSGTVQAVRAYAVTGGVTPPDTTKPVPPSTDTTAKPPVPGRATLATLPQASVDITLPTGYNVVNVGASPGALQQAIDAAGCRTELRGAPGFTYTPIVLRQKPCNELYHTVIRTGNGLPLLASGVRQTPETCVQRQCTRIVSKDAFNSPAVSADQNVRGYYFEDLYVGGDGTSDLNAVVKLGINQTTLAQVPGNFVFRHVVNSGTPTLRLKRNYYVNSFSTAIVDGSCLEGHDNNGDSQCFLGLNGPGPYLLENNYMEASHEVILFGGGDPSIPNLVPSDITIRHNHITRPASWKGVWTVKNLVECKNMQRALIENNILENNWADGQVGYAFLCKSVNQDGTASWSTSRDITFRYNIIKNSGAGINICGDCQSPSIPATRITAYDNIITGINCGIFTGEAREWQFLGQPSNLSITHNTTINACGVQTAVSFDGQPPKIVGMDFRSNAYDNGLYGIHGGSGGSDWRSWVDSSTANWTHNVAYPPGKWLEAGFNAQGYYSGTASTHDGRPLGANASLVYSRVQGVVVTDPSRPQLRRAATPAQSGYRPTTPEQRKKNTEGSGPSVN